MGFLNLPRELRLRSAVLDGEIVRLDRAANPSSGTCSSIAVSLVRSSSRFWA
jgi:hypothetical protein